MTIAHRPFTVVDGSSGPVHRAPTLEAARAFLRLRYPVATPLAPTPRKHADVHRYLVTGSGPSRVITIAPTGTAYRVMAS